MEKEEDCRSKRRTRKPDKHSMLLQLLLAVMG